MDDSRVLNGVIHVIQTGLRWREVLLSLKRPGMNAPELATGDGAMGFWAALHDIWQAETKGDAQKAFDLFIKVYEAKYPKAALCLQKDREELVASLNFPAQPRPAPPRIGKVSAPAIQLNPPSRQSAIAPSARKAACHAKACCI